MVAHCASGADDFDFLRPLASPDRLARPERLSLAPPKTDELRQFYLEYGFKTLLARNPASPASVPSVRTAAADGVESDDPAPSAIQNIETHYETILQPDQLERWILRVGQAELTCIDTETTGLDAMQSRLVGISCLSNQARRLISL